MAEKLRFGWSALPGALTKQWPALENGEPEPAVFLAHRKSNDLDDVLLANMLSAYGIPAIQVHPGDGAFGRVVLGMSGTGTDLYVPETVYEDAKALMEAENDDELQG